MCRSATVPSVTMSPRRRASIAGRNARSTRNGAARLMSSAWAKASASCSCTRARGKIPALLTRMSGAPAAHAVTRASSAATSSARVTSPATARCPAPSSCASPSSAAADRAASATRAPCSARARATAAPIPREAPVTSAWRPSSAPTFSATRWTDRTRGGGTPRAGDLLREALLDLESPREDVHDARQLGESDDAAVRDVGHVRLAEERQQVVLAERIHLDVADHHHGLVRFLEDRVADDARDVHLVSAREPRHRARDAHRGLHQPVALRILAQQLELSPHQLLQLAAADVADAGRLLAELPQLLERVAAGSAPGRLSGLRIRHSCSPFPRAAAG